MRRTPILAVIRDYPKSDLHQAAITPKSPNGIERSPKTLAAQKMLLRAAEGQRHCTKTRSKKFEFLAKTQRLRAKQLARETGVRPKEAKNTSGAL